MLLPVVSTTTENDLLLHCSYNGDTNSKQTWRRPSRRNTASLDTLLSLESPKPSSILTSRSALCRALSTASQEISREL